MYLLDDTFGIYDPETQKWLKTAAEDAEERANQEADARHEAEAEVARPAPSGIRMPENAPVTQFLKAFILQGIRLLG